MLYTLPQAGPAPIVRFIEDARGQLAINVYYLDDRQILRAITGAADRGVSVFVMVDGRPYGIARVKVRQEIAALDEAGAHVEIAPARFEGAYRFDHAKYAASQGEALIGSANWGWSAFHRDRDDLYVTTNSRVVQVPPGVFRADWTNTPAGATPRGADPDLVVSPGAEDAIVGVIDQPGPVTIETEELGNDAAVMRARERKGAEARVLFPSSLSAADRGRVAAVQRHGVRVRFLPARPVYLHVKVIVGERYGFVGSENFSEASLRANREIGIVLRRASNLARLREQFEQDWNTAIALHQPS